MYISAKNREFIKNKFGGRCAYSGSILKPDWQIDHIIPVVRDQKQKFAFPQFHFLANMVPCQREINHFKGSHDLEFFRNSRLGTLHRKLQHLPEFPVTIPQLKDKEYHLVIAEYFKISVNRPFSGRFFFEQARFSSVYRNQRNRNQS
jgi:hypothetical protein